jgi:(R)-2-hydroxyacyl-CoA dehydratese activating ATPase
MISAGIDIGSAFSKGVIAQNQKTLGSCILPSGGDFRIAAERVKNELIACAGLPQDSGEYVIATGLGAKMATFANETKSELACQARGIFELYPAVRTAVDIGDSYSRAFRIDENGKLARFLMNTKCAGGSARILKKIAKILQVDIDDLGRTAPESETPTEFNTNCAVFAESEAVSRLAEGSKKEDLLAGIYRALASQVSNLAERIGIESDFALVGGGAKHAGLVKAVEEIIGLRIVVPPNPQLCGALGAALIAGETSRIQLN